MVKIEKFLTVALILAALLLIVTTLSSCAPLPAPGPGAASTSTSAPAPLEVRTPTPGPDSPVSSDDPTPNPARPGLSDLPATNTPGGDRPPSGGIKLGEDAVVEDLDILILESFPVQVRVVLKGYLPDGCTDIQEIRSSREGQRFTLHVITGRPPGMTCTQALVPFEESTALDVLDLPAGSYTVQAGNVTETFTLDIDNTLSGPVGGAEDQAPAVCPQPGEGQALFVDEARSYCFLYPADFTSLPVDRPLTALLRGPEHGEGPGVVPASLSISALDAEGRSLEEFTAGLADEFPGVKLNVTPLTLGEDTPAVAVEGQPGVIASRMVYAVHGGQILVISLQPLQPDALPQSGQDLERLYELLAESWTWAGQ